MLSVWSAEECRAVHAATLELLADVGVEVRHDLALGMFRDAGAEVLERRVRIPARLVEEALAGAPREWFIKPRGGPTAPLVLRDGEVYYGTGSDVLYVRDLESGERRRVRQADVEGMAALCERLPNIDFVMSMGLPEDAAQAVDDLAQVVAMLRGTRKPLLVAPRDGTVLERMQQMAALCGERDSLAIYAMPSPPLMHDADALTKVIGCAELSMPLVYAPAPNMGATGPRSIAGSVLVGNAETLSGLVLHQSVRRGAPFVYGVGAGAMDMRTMTDPYLAPEALLAQQVGTDLARYYALPSFSYAGMSDSKTLDEQWSAEAALSMAYGSLSRATLLHDVGYLESGLQSSYESIVLGDELAGYARQFMHDVPVDDYALALSEIRNVGPGGSHLGTKYTRRHHREFWMPGLLDRAVHDRWAAEGAATLKQRVRARVAALCAEERPFLLTAEQDADLEAMLGEAVSGRGASA